MWVTTCAQNRFAFETDLDPTKGIIVLFFLALTGKVRRNKNIFFQISMNKSKANQLFPVLRFFVL